MIVQQEYCRDDFDDNMIKWAHSIIVYCKTTQVRSTAIQIIVEDYDESVSAGKYIML